MHITEAHRKRAFALINQFADHLGYKPKAHYETMKRAYLRAYETEFTMKPGVCTIEAYDRFVQLVIDLANDMGLKLRNPADDLSAQMIKVMRYNADMGVLGVQFNKPVPGSNDKGVLLYKMDAEGYADLMSKPEPKQYFIDCVYGVLKTVEL